MVGATDSPGTFGAIATSNLLDHSRFDGRVTLVARGRSEVFGRPALNDVRDLPHGVDVVLVAVRRETAVDVLEVAAQRGAAHAVVFAAGFSESDETGRRLQERITSLRRWSGMRVVGPNSPGLGDLRAPLGLTIQPGFADELLPGTIGLIAQSGGLTRCVLQGNSRAIGFSRFVSPGNQVDLDIADYLVHLVDHPATNVVAIVSEGVGDADRFEAAAAHAADRDVPVVLLKIGRSTAGRTAASSHTGALVGSYAAAAAIARRHGIALVEDVEDLLVTSAHLARPAAAAPGIAVYGMSGGAGVLVADHLGARGLELVELAPGTVSRLAAVVGPGPVPRNPVDIGGAALLDGTAYADGLQAVVDDPGVGTVLVTLNAWYRAHGDRFVETIAAVAAATDKALVPVWMSDRSGGRQVLDRAGLPPASSARSAAAAVAAMLARRGRDDRRPPGGAVIERAEALARLVAGEPAPGVVTEHTAKRHLAAAGLPVADERLCPTVDDALDAAKRVTYPVVVKALSPDVLHRGGTGMVSAPVPDDESLERAWRDVDAAARRHAGPGRYELLVAHFVAGGVEAHVGATTDPEWGALVSVGLGGRSIELVGDSQLVGRRPSMAEVRSAVARSRLAAEYARRYPGGRALEQLAGIAAVVGWLVALSPAIDDVDLNPVVLTEHEAVIVDALVVLGCPRDDPVPASR